MVLPSTELRIIIITIASMSATVGSIVVVFLIFASGQIREILATGEVPTPKAQILVAQSWMLEVSSTVSICLLISNSLLAILGLFFSILPMSWLVILTVALFALGILCLMGPLLVWVLWELRMAQALIGR